MKTSRKNDIPDEPLAQVEPASEPDEKLGGDASVAVWKKGMGTGATIDADFVAYSTVKGAFAGLSIDGSVLDVRESLNTAFYGKPVRPADIIVKREVSNPAASGLLAAVSKATK